MRHVVGTMNMRLAYKPGATGGENKSNESSRGHYSTDILM
jgi:hypothetical protein